jgi:hypothetical protein
MIKPTLIICLVWLFVSCSNRSIHHPQHKEKIILSDSGFGKPYTIHRQFLSSAKCENKINYASVFVCTAMGTADSVYVVSPCQNTKFRLGTIAVLFRPQNISTGDTLILEASVEIIDKIKKDNYLVGNLYIPEE